MFDGLFEREVPNYASASFPTPRPFQETAHQALRNGVRDGYKNQMLMAPTGAGKTILALRVVHEALARGKRAIFVCDRTTLIDQTSKAADSVGLSAHGVLQANHHRADRSMPFQIASAQTLARRNWPDADVIVIDEAHTQYASWVEHIKTCRARVVGLSATPFSRGLGNLFSNLVNATTAHELTKSGVLVPMRVLSSTRPDMTGAETAGGEWTDKAAAERGMEIVGDVVSEWHKNAYGRKTIVFGATIAHCEEIAKKFNESGVRAAVFSSKTPDGERVELLEEYRKPDSQLRVLISVEALCVDSQTEILTRRGWATINDISPDDRVASFNKDTGAISFAAPKNIIRRQKGERERMVHAESTRVSIRVTEGHRMLVPIGERPRGRSPSRWKFVSAVDCAGKANTSVPVSGYAAPEKLEIPVCAEIPFRRRLSANSYVLRRNGYSAVEAEREALARIQARASMKRKAPHELSLDECRLIGFWIGDGSVQKLSNGGLTYTFTQSMRYASIVEWFDGVISRTGVDATRHVIPHAKIAKAKYDVVKWAIPRGTGFGAQKRNGLFALEPYLNKLGTDLFWGLNIDQFLALIEGFDLADGIHYRHPSRPVTSPRITNTCKQLLDLLQAIGVCRGCRVSIGKGCTSGRSKPIYSMTVRAGHGHMTNAMRNAKVDSGVDGEMVWCVETIDGTIVTRRNGSVTIMGNCKGFDVPQVTCVCDCRPLRKSLSTAVQMWGRGLRACPDINKEECLLLDFSGNILRFAKDYEEIFFNGLAALDHGEKLDKTIRQEPEEKEQKGCPSCGAVPFIGRCMACGHVAKRASEVVTVASDGMHEVRIGTGSKAAVIGAYELWQQVCAYARGHSAPEKQAARAKYLYRDISGMSPLVSWSFSGTPSAPLTREVMNQIKARNIAYARSRRPG